MGTDEQWERATNALMVALDKKGWAYKINEGDGAFYGPKIDIHLEDCIGRTWQCGTVQLDFQLPVYRHPDRAFCRRIPTLAGTGAGESVDDYQSRG